MTVTIFDTEMSAFTVENQDNKISIYGLFTNRLLPLAKDIVITVDQIRNPLSSEVTFNSFEIKTTNSVGQGINKQATGLSFALVPGSVTDVSLTASSYSVDTDVYLTASFTTLTKVVSPGFTMRLYYPSELQLAGSLPNNCLRFVGFAAQATCSLNSDLKYLEAKYTNGYQLTLITGLWFHNPLGALKIGNFMIKGYDANNNLLWEKID
jgi:hypothetical protein